MADHIALEQEKMLKLLFKTVSQVQLTERYTQQTWIRYVVYTVWHKINHLTDYI